MILSFSSKKPDIKQNMLNTQEAYNLWGILASKYLVAEKLNMWNEFVHDLDLKVIIKILLNEIDENTNILEAQLKKYLIKGPEHSRYAVNSPVNPEVMQDKYIARDIFVYNQEHIENLVRSIRTSMTNDEIRTIFKKMCVKTIEEQDKIVQYLKAKGWIETPPLYQDTPDNVQERLSSCDAYHIWDHLAYRYDNIHQTLIFHSFAYDGDFKVVLKMGIDILNRQAKIFEKELKYFGIPLPTKASDIIVPPANTELLDDKYMYRMVLQGIQGITSVHAHALKQCTYNDRLRNIFKKILIEEIDELDKMIKFGKAKGWLDPVPAYKA